MVVSAVVVVIFVAVVVVVVVKAVVMVMMITKKSLKRIKLKKTHLLQKYRSSDMYIYICIYIYIHIYIYIYIYTGTHGGHLRLVRNLFKEMYKCAAPVCYTKTGM